MRSLIFGDVGNEWGALWNAWDALDKRRGQLLLAGQEVALAAPPKKALQLTEDDDNFLVTGEFPGLTPDGVSVKVFQNTITISVSQDTEEGKKGQPKITRSIRETRVFYLDGVKADEITVKLIAGKLTVTMPKIDSIRRKTLPISTE